MIELPMGDAAAGTPLPAVTLVRKNGRVALPGVKLMPRPPRRFLLTQRSAVTVRVDDGGQASEFARQVQAAYAGRIAEPEPGTLPWVEPIPLQAREIRITADAPGAEVLVYVEVRYQWIDENKPHKPYGSEHTGKGQFRLALAAPSPTIGDMKDPLGTLPEVVLPVPEPAPLPAPASVHGLTPTDSDMSLPLPSGGSVFDSGELECEWEVPDILAGMEPAVLNVLSTAGKPTVTVQAAPGVEGDTAWVTDLIRVGTPVEREPGRYQVRFSIEDTSKQRDALNRAISSGAVRAQVSVRVGGLEVVLSGDSGLAVRTHETLSVSVLAIDVGYHSTAAALHDPTVTQDFPTLASPEQLASLRGSLKRRLNTDAAQVLGGAQHAANWAALLDRAARSLQAEAGPKHLRGAGPAPADVLGAALSELGVYPVLRHLELALFASPVAGGFRRAVTTTLHTMYAEAAREFPLQASKLYVVGLNPDLPDERQEVPSDAKVTDLGPPLKLDFGQSVVRDRLSIKRDEWKAVAGQFPGPVKRMYQHLTDRTETVAVAGPRRGAGAGIQQARVRASELPAAMLRAVLERVNAFRRSRRTAQFCQRQLHRVIVTFPTAASLTVRQGLGQLARRELRLASPKLSYDEGTAHSLFVVAEQFRGDIEFGLDALLSRCRPVRDPATGETRHWVQNLLLVDVGGGTIDLCLVRVTLKQEDPFARATIMDRGAGGRYYVLTPRLLAVNGREQLGGDVLTLAVFARLKLKIADALATAWQTLRAKPTATVPATEASALGQAFMAMPDGIKTPAGEYEAGAILAAADPSAGEYDGASVGFAARFETPGWIAASQFLPTAWHVAEAVTQRERSGSPGELSDPGRIGAFHALFDLAEKVKRQFAAGAQYVDLTWADLLPSLTAAGLAPASALETLVGPVRMTEDEFSLVLRQELETQAEMAEAMVQRSLNEDRAGDMPTGEPELDLVVFSGNACRLPQVRAEVIDRLAENRGFRWNRERFDFSEKYAKLGTVLGACYAESWRLQQQKASTAVPRLHRGENVLRVDLSRMLSTLPVGFRVSHPQPQPLFAAGDALEFDPRLNEWCKVSEPCDVFDTHVITQVISSSSNESKAWGSLALEELRGKGLGLSAEDFQYAYQIRYEVRQGRQLEVTALLSQGTPHRQHQRTDSKFVNISDSLRGQLSGDTEADLWPAVSGWELGVGTPGDNPGTVKVLSLGTFDAVFHSTPDDTAGCRVAVSTTPLPELSAGVCLKVRVGSDGDWRHLMEVPAEMTAAPASESLQALPVTVLLDETGAVYLNRGYLPFWETDLLSQLKTQPGRVYRAYLGPTRDMYDPYRDPKGGRI